MDSHLIFDKRDDKLFNVFYCERRRLGFTQVEAARFGAVSRDTWIKYERGDSLPSLDVLASLALRGFDIEFIVKNTKPRIKRSIPAKLRVS